MSKTMDELMAAFKTGFRDRLQGPGIRPEGDIAIRAGIAAVVRAVRDAAARSEYPLRMLNEILGDAGDEAAGGSSSNADKATEAGGARCATTSASAPATTHCPVCNGKGWDRFDSPCPPCEATGRVPATDPAPAVCVWTPRKNMGWFQPSCRKSRMHETSAALKICPSCGKPIKFTEAQR